MNPTEITIGRRFSTTAGMRFQCTDVGTRTVIAIPLEPLVNRTGHEARRLSEAEARSEGWFNGPPYAVAELVFDENDLETCTPEPDHQPESRSMTKCRAKSPELTVITFQGLIDWAKAADTPLVNGVPWSFTYSGHPVTHENDDLYLVAGHQMRREDVLVLSTRNEVWIYPAEEFAELYDVTTE